MCVFRSIRSRIGPLIDSDAILQNETPGRKPLEWKLLTNIPVDCNEDAIEKLE